MVQLTEVTKSYGTARGVENVSFSISPGQVVGLLGPNGAGKTTIMKIITGYHYAGSGKVDIGGFDPMIKGVEVKRLIGYLPENAPVYREMLVREYLEFMAETRLGPSGYSEAIQKAAEATGISEVLHRRVSELSKGYRQRVGLAQAILHDPPILILDEPTSGLDPNQIQEIRRLIKILSREKTIILSTHILQEVEALCDRVLILNQGQIAAEGSPSEIAAQLEGGVSIELKLRAQGREGEEVLTALLGRLKSWTGELEVKKNEQADSHRFRLIAPTELGEEKAAEDLFQAVLKEKAVILRLSPKLAGLEDLFVQLTAGDGGKKHE